MTKIESETASIVAEKISMPVDEVDRSYVAYVLETRGLSVFPNDLSAKVMESRDGDRIEAVYRVGRRYYVRRWYHGYSESADWRSLHPTTALLKIEEWLNEDEEEDEIPELPDDPDSIEDLLLDIDA